MRGGGEPAAEELRALLHEVGLLLLRGAALADELTEAGYAREHGYESTVEWIRHECRVAFGVAADLVCVGSQMGVLADSVRAVERGEIGYGHLVHMARTQREVGEERGIDEARLLAEAREVSVSRFWHVCRQARHAADPHGFEAEHREQFEQRAVRVNRRQDGTVTLSGILDPVGGALVKAALEPLARRAGREDLRTRDQRMADALVDVVGHNTKTHVSITATLGTLLEVPHSSAGDVNGSLVPASVVRRMTCGDASIRRVLFEPGSVVIDVGREKRVVTPVLRRALETRDEHCRFPGCWKPASWCEAHHLIHWSSGGRTSLPNLVLLCSHHHALVHEGGWQLELRPGGRIEVLRPPLDFAAPPRGPARAA